MSRLSRRTKFAAAAAAGALALTLTAAPSAFAGTYIGSQPCNGNWSYTSATATQSVTHYHEIPANWKRTTKPAGYSNYKGWYDQGTVWMEISSPATLTTHLIACKG